MSVSIRDFGKSTTGQTVKLAVLKNEFIEVQLLSYAAVIHRILVPDRKGNPVDVVLGYPTAADYELNTDSMGAAVGRFANRIAGAQFPLYEEIVHVTPNQNGNCLHSGLHGFNHTLFDVALTPGETDSVTMTAFSPDHPVPPGQERAGHPLHCHDRCADRLQHDEPQLFQPERSRQRQCAGPPRNSGRRCLP